MAEKKKNGMKGRRQSIVKQTFSALTLVWFQIFFPAEIIPKFLNKILGFAVGPVLCYAVYILLLALFRKRWDRKTK